jgi:hypoxanthine phosphoribosyltransferase
MIFHSIWKDTLRPNCKEFVTPTNCIGMPSGHAEIGTMILLYLYSKKYISSTVGCFLSTLVGLQRIISKNHTMFQVLIGILFGIFYFNIYSYEPWYIIIILFLYANILLYKVERSFTIPSWIKNREGIDKKRNISYSIKLLNVISPSFQQERPFSITWKEVTKCLDDIIESLSDTQIDAIVGIKTGGAILTDYISTKINAPVYSVKVSNKRYQCKKKNVWDDYIQNYILQKKPRYMVCEGIEQIHGNVLLIDECVGSGGTIKTATKYLYEKGASRVIAKTITSPSTIKIDSIIKREYTPAVWPWGYDN